LQRVYSATSKRRAMARDMSKINRTGERAGVGGEDEV